MKGFPDLPPLWLAAFMALAWIMARFAPLVTVSSGLLRSVGIIVAVLGFAAIAWSAVWFWRKRTTIEPHHTPGTLIIEGPYRLSRNPIYLGMLLILTGQVLWQGALSPIILLPAFLLILTARFAKPEEQSLIAAFGEEGQRYLSATRRWI
jgi:protein-S-isoprenylcysteine O-methyltransferase Ste14